MPFFYVKRTRCPVTLPVKIFSFITSLRASRKLFDAHLKRGRQISRVYRSENLTSVLFGTESVPAHFHSFRHLFQLANVHFSGYFRFGG